MRTCISLSSYVTILSSRSPWLSRDLKIYESLCLFVYLSALVPTYLHIYLAIYLSICSSTYLPTHLSSYLCQPVKQAMNQFVVSILHPSVSPRPLCSHRFNPIPSTSSQPTIFHWHVQKNPPLILGKWFWNVLTVIFACEPLAFVHDVCLRNTFNHAPLNERGQNRWKAAETNINYQLQDKLPTSGIQKEPRASMSSSGSMFLHLS